MLLKRYLLIAFISLSVFDSGNQQRNLFLWSDHVGKRFQTILCSIEVVNVAPSNAICLRMCFVLDARNPQKYTFSNKYLLAD